MLLIYPPVSKPCEPPAGVAKLSGTLKQHGVKHRVVDANIEGLLYLLNNAAPPTTMSDVWTKRAIKNNGKNLAGLREHSIYRTLDRYKRAVLDINRVLEISSDGASTISLANYQHSTLSPLKSGDLLWAAEHPEENPFFPYFSGRLRSLLKEDRPAVAGFSLNYLSQALSTFAMIGFLRRECPDLLIVLGGGLVTSWIKGPEWRNPFGGLADRLVAGPGESELISLIGKVDSDKVHVAPYYDSLPLADYFSPGLILPYSGSSGCYWNRCSFCPEKAEGNRYVAVPTEKAVADLHMLSAKRNPALIHLLDNAVSTSLMKAIIAAPPRMPWYGFARIDRHLADFDYCSALKQSGCVMLKLGLESGDQGVLDRLEKGVDLGVASRALKMLRKAGIAVYVYLLFGTPAETIQEARKTLDFTVRHRGEIDFLNLAIFNMPVAAAEASGLKTSSFYDGDLSLYTDFVHPSGWNRKEVRLFVENEFKRQPSISAILRKEPPIFTSNHAPFFVSDAQVMV
jgi:radical SAM superfamily enzyme YgiQ (UPF0313 family)